LYKVKDIDAYLKEIYTSKNRYDLELKCANSYELPFIVRYLNGEEVTDSDRVFYHEGRLAKYMEDPEIEVNLLGR